MTDLLDQLRAARRDLIAQMAADMAPDKHLPDAGYLSLLANLQGAITAIEAVMKTGE
jgi:hypothetical protein